MAVAHTVDCNHELYLVDLGSNCLFEIADIPNLACCSKLYNVNMLGNTRLCKQPGHCWSTTRRPSHRMQQLIAFDGRRVDESKAPKEKQAASDPSSSRKGLGDDGPPQEANDAPAAAASRKPAPCAEADAAAATPAAGKASKPADGKPGMAAGKVGGGGADAGMRASHLTEEHSRFVKEEIVRLRKKGPALDHLDALRRPPRLPPPQ